MHRVERYWFKLALPGSREYDTPLPYLKTPADADTFFGNATTMGDPFWAPGEATEVGMIAMGDKLHPFLRVWYCLEIRPARQFWFGYSSKTQLRPAADTAFIDRDDLQLYEGTQRQTV